MTKILQNDPNITGEHLSSDKERWFVKVRGKRGWVKLIPRARYIMAKHLCCVDFHIPETFVVHHISGNSCDDRIENLQLLNAQAHINVYNLKRLKNLKYGVRFTGNATEYARKQREMYPERQKIYNKKYSGTHKEQNQKRALDYYYKNLERYQKKYFIKKYGNEEGRLKLDLYLKSNRSKTIKKRQRRNI